MAPEDDLLLPLIQNISEGDESSMETFYNLTINRVYGLAVKIVSKPELAEEVINDVFLHVWNKASHFDAKKAVPMAWLFMICRSRALDRLRREKSATKNQYQASEESQVSDVSPTLLEDFEEIERSSKVYAALKILNKQQRQTIALAFYKGMSHQEISQYTGDPLGTVKTNIRRAQDILRAALIDEHISKGGVYGQA